MVSPITRFTLPNGLQVVHQQDTATVMVALNILYNTGSRDEVEGLTGMAHLVEHLMFSGSANVSDFDGELQMAGGMSNAWTSNDFTNFYEILPAVNAEVAFRLESDRMLAPAISEENFRIQRSVVLEEFKQQCLNRPYGDLDHHLRSMAYKFHPYRTPVIGAAPADIERMTRDDILAYIRDYYSPSNAVLAVTGNISIDETRRLATKWMADIPARHVARRDYPAEPSVVAPRHVEVEGDVPQTMIVMAWAMDRYGTPGYIAADTITDVLSNGRSARFYRNLMLGTDTFASIDASIMGAEEPGLLIVKGVLRSEGKEAEAVRLIDNEIKSLREDGITAHELERAVNKFESNLLFSNLHYAQKAQTLALDTLHGEDYGSQVAAYRRLTTDDIRQEALRVLDPQRKMTLIYRPRG